MFLLLFAALANSLSAVATSARSPEHNAMRKLLSPHHTNRVAVRKICSDTILSTHEDSMSIDANGNCVALTSAETASSSKLCALSNTSFSDGCTLVSAGRPATMCGETMLGRATRLRGGWEKLALGFTEQADNECTTPQDCTRGNTTYLAVEVGVPGHGYRDMLRAASYARASRSAACGGGTTFKNYRRGNVDHHDRGGAWATFFLKEFLRVPGVNAGFHRTTGAASYAGTPTYAPIFSGASAKGSHVCCPLCAAADGSAEDPFIGFSKGSLDWVRCGMWRRLELDGDCGVGEQGVRVLLVLRGGSTRRWGSDRGIEQALRSSPALAHAGGGKPPSVTAVRLEDLSPEKQCRAVAASHVVVGMHGSALGNLLCAKPGAVVVEVFPPGFYLDMFGLLAAAVDVYNIQVLGGDTSTSMTRGYRQRDGPGLWGEAQTAARDVGNYSPPREALESALGWAGRLLRQEAASGWAAYRRMIDTCEEADGGAQLPVPPRSRVAAPKPSRAPVPIVHLKSSESPVNLPLCFSGDVSEEERAAATAGLVQHLAELASPSAALDPALLRRCVTIPSTGRTASGGMTSVIEYAGSHSIPSTTNNNTAASADAKWTVLHTHRRCPAVERSSCAGLHQVVYVFDDPVEVVLSLRKDVFASNKGLAGAKKHFAHIQCSKPEFLTTKSAARMGSMMLTSDVFGIEDHVGGFMASHGGFSALSLTFSVFHSSEAARVLAAFLGVPQHVVAAGWAAADAAHAAASVSSKKQRDKVPRGAERLAALSEAERGHLNATFGAASRQFRALPPICIWPRVPSLASQRITQPC